MSVDASMYCDSEKSLYTHWTNMNGNNTHTHAHRHTHTLARAFEKRNNKRKTNDYARWCARVCESNCVNVYARTHDR